MKKMNTFEKLLLAAACVSLLFGIACGVLFYTGAPSFFIQFIAKIGGTIGLGTIIINMVYAYTQRKETTEE